GIRRRSDTYRSPSGRRLEVDQLEQRHRRGVALARAELDHPRVAAVALGEARRDVGEELVDDVVRAELGHRVAHDYAGSSSPFSVRPWAASVSRTSSIDLRPKFGIAASSFSDFDVRS